jgi:hypothetical protein
MLRTFVIVLLFPLISFCQKKQITGNYKVKFDKQYKLPKFHIYISDSTFYKQIKSEIYYGKVYRIFHDSQNTTSVNLIDDLQKAPVGEFEMMILKSFGRTMLEFEDSPKRVIRFRTTFVNNLHLMINEGRLIRSTFKKNKFQKKVQTPF